MAMFITRTDMRTQGHNDTTMPNMPKTKTVNAQQRSYLSVSTIYATFRGAQCTSTWQLHMPKAMNNASICPKSLWQICQMFWSNSFTRGRSPMSLMIGKHENCIWTLIIGRHQGWNAGVSAKVHGSRRFISCSNIVDCGRRVLFGSIDFSYISFHVLHSVCLGVPTTYREWKRQTSWHQPLSSFPPDKPCTRCEV